MRPHRDIRRNRGSKDFVNTSVLNNKKSTSFKLVLFLLVVSLCEVVRACTGYAPLASGVGFAEVTATQ